MSRESKTKFEVNKNSVLIYSDVFAICFLIRGLIYIESNKQGDLIYKLSHNTNEIHTIKLCEKKLALEIVAAINKQM